MALIHVLLIEGAAGDALLAQEAIKHSIIPVKLVIARDGEQALMFLGAPNAKPDLIILDLTLPGISAFALLERFQAQGIPIVVFSSSLNPEDAQRAIKLGAREFARKPLELTAYTEAVLTIIQKWVPGKVL